MDATWKINCEQQIRGNPVMDYEFKLDLIKIVNQLNEDVCEALGRETGMGERFFYDAKPNDEKFLKALKKVVEDNHIYSQKAANEEAKKFAGSKEIALELNRRGITHHNANRVYDKLYETTYRRAGHLYVYGYRIY